LHNNGQYTHILTNNAQDLRPYRFEFKCNTNRKRKYFMSVQRFEPRSASANSAMYFLLYFSTGLRGMFCYLASRRGEVFKSLKIIFLGLL
jgi:hypothetical protein